MMLNDVQNTEKNLNCIVQVNKCELGNVLIGFILLNKLLSGLPKLYFNVVVGVVAV